MDSIKREGTEIARYRVSAGERVLIGRRAPRGAEIVDVPTAAGGRYYHVDHGYRDAGVLAAFVKDYLEQAKRFDACPMSREAIGSLLHSSDEDELVAVMLDAV
jgi:hypothetical protein